MAVKDDYNYKKTFTLFYNFVVFLEMFLKIL